jgi:hypothetical protein
MEPSAPQEAGVPYEPASVPFEQEEEEEEDDEYDPSNLVTPALDSSASAQRASTTPVPHQGAPKVVRTRGGFVVSDDEDDNEGVAGGQSASGTNGLLNGAGVAASAQRSLTGTPINAVSTASLPIQSTEDIPSRESVLNPAASASITDTNGTAAVAPARTVSASVQPDLRTLEEISMPG